MLSTSAAVAALWDRFRPLNLERVDAILAALDGPRTDPTGDEPRRQAAREAHKLAGALGTFGLAEAARLARSIEQRLVADAPFDAATVAELRPRVVRLRQLVDRGPERESGLAAGSRGRLIALIPDGRLADDLSLEAVTRGLGFRAIADPAAIDAAIAADPPSAILFDLATHEQFEAGLEALAGLVRRVTPVPVLVLADRETQADRVAVARCGGRGYLARTLSPGQVLDAIDQALQQARAIGGKVLAVDDDPSSLAIIVAILEPAGVRVVCLDDPAHFWDTLEETSPDLLMLDLEMPDLTGIDLCRVVRNDPRWSRLPILFLTARADPDVIRQVFAAGADDYVIKPIVAPELITRIANRLERASIQRTLAETDSLTGIANRRAFAEAIGRAIRVATRRQQPVSLALIDLDHFKLVNDRHGHATGDQVLRWFSQRLLQSFRGDDLVARWGGEEFAVGLIGTSRADAAQRLGTILGAIREEDLHTPSDDAFRVTFSAGIAQFPDDGTTVSDLFRVADRALYQAKRAGRNRVIAAG